MPANGLLDLALDFDAQRSIVLTGNGTYKLKPTIRVLPFSTAGTITGSVTPVTSTTVYALQGADTLEAASTNSLGQFTLSALAAGSYSVALRPVNTLVYRDTTLASVSVASQATTSLGVVALTPR